MAKYRDPEYMSKWRAANREKLRKDRRAWYEGHKREETQSAYRWRDKNKFRFSFAQKAAAANAKYPGRKLRGKDVRSLLESQGRVCYWCKKKNLADDDVTLEHLKPNNDDGSLAIACFACNSSKIALRARKETE